MKKLVVLTGAGISAESGLKTFRDSDGLWEGHNIEDVATPQAWKRDPELVQQFYNERRKNVLEAQPNAAHLALAGLEKHFNVQIITQNIDDLHERAGSTQVLHLHGIITLSQSDVDSALTYPIDGWELRSDALCEYGMPLRPHVVWFGEDVPNISKAAAICAKADIFVVIGTSLQVYPAAGLTRYVPGHVLKYLIDPKAGQFSAGQTINIAQPATTGVALLVNELLAG